MLLLLLACPAPSLTDDTSLAASETEDTGPVFTDCAERVWWEGDLDLQFQSEVDGFCDTHNAIRGDLSIDVSNNDDTITELDGISCLCEVDGDLTVYSTDDAATAGPPPPHITGDLELFLQRISGNFTLQNLPLLTYLQELWSLEEVGGSILIDGCPALQYSALYTLATVGGTITLRDLGKLLVFRMPSLTSAQGISLGTPGDGESLYFLVEVNLSSLTTLGGDLSLTGTRNLGLLSAPLLTAIDGALHIEAACSLRPALPVLSTLGSLRIDGACGIDDFSGLPALTALNGQDADGNSLWLSASEGLDDQDVSDLLGRLSSTPPGDIVNDTTTTCADVLSGYGAAFCE